MSVVARNRTEAAAGALHVELIPGGVEPDRAMGSQREGVSPTRQDSRALVVARIEVILASVLWTLADPCPAPARTWNSPGPSRGPKEASGA